MPTTREKNSRKRTGSTSSDSGLPSSLPSPRAVGHTVHEMDGELPYMESELLGLSLDSSTALLPCCNPRGCVLGPIEQAPPTVGVVRVSCSNEKCPFSSYMHLECFDTFEEYVLSCLRGMSRARNWSEKQRKQNLWNKKGYDLIFKFCTCRCGKGSLRKDLNHVISETPPMGPSHSSSSSSTTSTVMIAQGGGADKKKKRKKSSSLSDKTPPTQHRTRSRSHCNSDSISSDNGLSYMQPFAHRTDYSVFNRLLPRHMVNGYHIKMEDDGYAAGDDTRSFVLSSLAYHRTNSVSCVLCDARLEVFDRFPLINGTFYLTPVQPKETSLEVESKGDDPTYMSALCLQCMVGINSVVCIYCNKKWNGSCHQIGTMYSYDLFAATPCCVSSLHCKRCHRPIADISTLSLSFTQLSSQLHCPHCSASDYHFIKPLARFKVTKSTSVVDSQT